MKRTGDILRDLDAVSRYCIRDGEASDVAVEAINEIERLRSRVRETTQPINVQDLADALSATSLLGYHEERAEKIIEILGLREATERDTAFIERVRELAEAYENHGYDIPRADLYNALAIIDRDCVPDTIRYSDHKIYCDAHMRPWPCFNKDPDPVSAPCWCGETHPPVASHRRTLQEEQN